MDRAHQPTPATLRARIAETRVKQWRVAQRLGIAEVQLSHTLVERRPPEPGLLERIAEAIEAEAAEAKAPGAVA